MIDAVGAKATRNAALAAVKPGGVVMHIGLQDWASEIDMRKLTLAEITLLGTYTYTTADLRATVAALHRGVFGDLAWVEERPLADGAARLRRPPPRPLRGREDRAAPALTPRPESGPAWTGRRERRTRDPRPGALALPARRSPQAKNPLPLFGRP